MMPVSKSSSVGSSDSKSGAGRWIGQRSASSRPSSMWSMGSPSTLRMRPSVAAPTGTVIGAPVSTTSVPRARPSVASMATARTLLSPRCCCTSAISSTGWPSRSIVIFEGVVDGGQLVGEVDVDHGADDLDDSSLVHDLNSAAVCRLTVSSAFRWPAMTEALGSAERLGPATTSRNSSVIDACRARFIDSV